MPASTSTTDVSSATSETSATPRASPPGGGHRRLEWLDALRGLAAAIVVFEHSLDVLFPEVREGASPWFDFGRYGVYVFFIVSGYIVPASLERRGSVREFWIGRVFRLYPAWAVAAVIALVIGLAGWGWEPEAGLTERPWYAALAHLTMLQDLLETPGVLVVFWTLSYEMAFYLLVTAMFAGGVHRASGAAALGFALCAVPAGVLLPAGALSARSWSGTIVAATLLMVAGLFAVMSRRPAARRCGALVLGGLALILLALNSRIGGLESCAILATMFGGTAIYRIQHGQARGRRAIALVAAVPLLIVAAGAAETIARGNDKWGWPVAVTAAWVTFLAGLALRDRRFPRLLPWLGVISYSVYLLHAPVVQIIWRATDEPERITAPVRLLWMAFLIGSVLVAGFLAHRYIELPMQRAGRRLIASHRELRARRRAARAAGTAAAVSAPGTPEAVEPLETSRAGATGGG